MGDLPGGPALGGGGLVAGVEGGELVADLLDGRVIGRAAGVLETLEFVEETLAQSEELGEVAGRTVGGRRVARVKDGVRLAVWGGGRAGGGGVGGSSARGACGFGSGAEARDEVAKEFNEEGVAAEAGLGALGGGRILCGCFGISSTLRGTTEGFAEEEFGDGGEGVVFAGGEDGMGAAVADDGGERNASGSGSGGGVAGAVEFGEVDFGPGRGRSFGGGRNGGGRGGD